MESYVFYCPACKQTLAGKYEKDATPNCPDCKNPVIPTGCTKAEWVEMSQKEKDAIIADISSQRPAAKQKTENSHTESSERAARPAGESIYAFTEAYCPGTVLVRMLLIVLLGLGVLISMIGITMPEALFVGPPMVGIAILGLIDLYLACWFYKAAISKGHTDGAYFWISFIFTLPGYLLVACLPDRGSPKA